MFWTDVNKKPDLQIFFTWEQMNIKKFRFRNNIFQTQLHYLLLVFLPVLINQKNYFKNISKVSFKHFKHTIKITANL